VPTVRTARRRQAQLSAKGSRDVWRRALGRVRIGISGWRYPPWRGVFYPPGLPQRSELEFAAASFSSIELNGSFYSLQSPDSYRRWHDDTPADFVFSVKAPRYITHIRRLVDVGTPLANFFASGLLRLRGKLGPVLWQFPPNFRFRAELLDPFLAMLPRSSAEALRLARRRDVRMHGRSALAIDADRPLRHAIEVRHESFRDPAFVALLRRHRVALVVADTAGRWPLLEDLTADFVYVRLHGNEELYVSGYTDAALQHWARRIAAWTRGTEADDAVHASPVDAGKRRARDVYCYFDNDAKVHAPFDAAELSRLLGLPARASLARRPAAAGGPARERWPGG
jgi:uncharacterized protein YecE (DUF72 family)